jgi:putative membrane protein
MKNLIKIIKGSFVGMGSILPGISGSMVAAILKIYQDLINALNQFTKEPIRSVKAVWQYIVGVFIGFGLGFILIKLFYQNAPIPITLLFIGFIFGAIPSLVNEVKGMKISWHHILVFALSILMMVGLLFLNEGSSQIDSWTEYVIVFLIGIITAVALITPGLSGATILVALGYFHVLVNLGDALIKAIITFDFSSVITLLPMLFILVLGVIIGLILIGKVMYFILQKYKFHFYTAILGIVFISPFNILFTLQNQTTNNVFQVKWYIYLIGFLLLILGVFTTFRLSQTKIKTEENHD